MNQFHELFQSIMDGDEEHAVTLTKALIANGVRPMDILIRGLLPAMDQLGDLLAREERFIPQILLSARTMQSALAEIQSLLIEEHTGKLRHDVVIVGTVSGDIHTIGKNLVGIMLRSGGFRVVDLGVNVSAEDFAAAIRKYGAHVIAMSAMLTTSMSAMRKIVQKLQKEDFGYPLSIIVGGAPITPNFARELHVLYSGNMMESMKLAMDATKDENY